MKSKQPEASTFGAQRCRSLWVRSLNLFLLTGDRQSIKLIADRPTVGSGKADRTNQYASQGSAQLQTKRGQAFEGFRSTFARYSRQTGLMM